MDRKNVKLFLGDAFIVLFFALSPGIRGYSNWRPLEYVTIIIIAAYILYLRHKKPRQSEQNQPLFKLIFKQTLIINIFRVF